MQNKALNKGRWLLIITMASLFFLFVSNLAFAMHGDEDKVGVRISPILLPPLSSEILVENNETSTPAIGADEEIKRRLAQAISERYDEYIEKSPPQFSLRELLPIVGIVSGLPYSQFAIQEARDSLFLKVYFTGSTLASVGLSRVWALDALFNEVWRDSKQKKITHLSVNILSLLSALPLTYAVWDDGHSILDTCIIFMSEWSIATLGFYEIFNKVSDQYSSLNRNGETATNQQLPSLENLNLPVRQFFRHLLSQPNPDVFAEEVCSSLEEEHVPNAPSMVRHVELAEIPKSTPKALTKGLFYIIPGASLIVNSVLAYQSIEAFTSSPFIIVPYMALTTLPTFALQLYTTSSSVDDLWGDTINKRSYFKAKNRKLFYLVGGLSLLISSGSSLWGVGVVNSAFEGSFLESAVPFFMFTTVAQLIIFESHCARDYIAKKYFHYKEVKGSEQEKKTTTLVKILDEVNEVATNTPSNNYAWYNPIGWGKKLFTYIYRTL